MDKVTSRPLNLFVVGRYTWQVLQESEGCVLALWQEKDGWVYLGTFHTSQSAKVRAQELSQSWKGQASEH